MEPELEDYISHFLQGEILNLNFRALTIRKAIRNYGITKEEAVALYANARLKIKRTARNRALVFLLVGAPFLAAGLLGAFSDTGFIIYLYGAILTGSALVITSICLFRLAI